ncbi:hypothetical protein [Streptomyces sp. NPDC059010]|uniref:hypothetical protein n=1 Tax=Streptomyces sp. NPDC059010 TaxID=3346695 RepID=UPI003684F8BF
MLITTAAAVSLISTALAVPTAAHAAADASPAQHSRVAAGEVGPASLQCNLNLIMCFWTFPDYRSLDNEVQKSLLVPSGLCRRITTGVSDLSTSFWNRTGATQRVWSEANCTGQNFLVHTGVRIPRSPFPVRSVGGV